MKKQTERKSRRSNYGYYEETPEATAFKRLYNKLQKQYDEQGLRVFMTTSSNTGEGKSTTTAFLATASARYRQTDTVLVDCDLRRPVVHKFYSLPNEGGVADILTRGVNIRSVLKSSAIPNLKILTAGVAERSPADLFSSERLYQLLDRLRAAFQIVLIDAPPIIPVSDSLLLSNVVEGILFVCKAGVTQKRVAQHALELLEDNRKKLLGVIINNMKGLLPYYYDYRYYDYKYYSHANYELE
ncbi:CpsD/CapB family tyrosine-protein kinase [candidate division KSB1 bacterium]|nr:CpsD/CapB family tyrosine-protein kinase [candidate division KSB1 bacterium]